jgi:hypothetical protein
MPWHTAVFLIAMAVIASIPTAFAWHAWHKTDRLGLTRWRNVTGVISLATTAFLWVGVGVLTPLIALLLPVHPGIVWGWVLIWGWVILKPLSILALPCAFALKGRSRWLALAAAVITQYFFSKVFESIA